MAHNNIQTWNLEVAPGKKIKLTFESFDLEHPIDVVSINSFGCDYDYMLYSDVM